jgi:hypothetical protein
MGKPIFPFIHYNIEKSKKSIRKTHKKLRLLFFYLLFIRFFCGVAVILKHTPHTPNRFPLFTQGKRATFYCSFIS